MKNYRLHTSEGVKDYLGEEVLIKRQIENSILQLLLSYGYQIVKTPTFEYIDVFSLGKKNHQQPALYNLINRQGEFLALRSDMTASIARVIATKDNNSLVPKKYCYSENTFRYPAFYQGKTHEFTQIGIELVGIKNQQADLEVILLASKILEINNIKDYTIHISDVRFLDSLLKSLNLNAKIIEQLKEVIAKKDFVGLEKLLIEAFVTVDMVELIVDLMKSGGRISFLKKLKGKVNQESALVLTSLEDLYLELKKILPVERIVFDFSVYVYADYYTGLVFQVFTNGANRALVNGGRYDDLLEQFTTSFPAVGFGADLDCFLDIVQSQKLVTVKVFKILSYLEKNNPVALELNTKLRLEGNIVEESFHKSYEEAYYYAKNKRFNQIIKYYQDTYEIIDLEEDK